MNLPQSVGPLGLIHVNMPGPPSCQPTDAPVKIDTRLPAPARPRPFPYHDDDTSKKKRDKATPPAMFHRRSFRASLDNDLAITPTTDIEAALRASKRAKK